MSKQIAIFASGCFWGTEYFFNKKNGVISTYVGYIGGHVENPTYKEVCSGNTNHAEATLVTYDSNIVSYADLCKLFFETHNPEQEDRQGPDIGTQYRSEIFYLNFDQKKIAERLILILRSKSYVIKTKVSKASKFWKAENYHQNYYENNGGTPYCHGYEKKF